MTTDTIDTQNKCPRHCAIENVRVLMPFDLIVTFYFLVGVWWHHCHCQDHDGWYGQCQDDKISTVFFKFMSAIVPQEWFDANCLCQGNLKESFRIQFSKTVSTKIMATE